MGNVEAYEHPGWGRLRTQLLANATTGDVFDSMVLKWRPRPGFINRAPSEQVLEVFARERNLYAECLRASVAEDIESVLLRPSAQKRRVRRALAANQNLSNSMRKDLAEEAIASRDATMALALLHGAPKILDLILAQPKLLALVSARTGQPGPQAISSRLDRSSPDTAAKVASSYRSDRHLAELLVASANVFAYKFSKEEFHCDPVTLCAVANLLPSGTLHEIPTYYYPTLEEASGSTVLGVARVFNLGRKTGKGPDPVTPDSALRRVGHFSEDRVCESNLEIRNRYDRIYGLTIDTWCQPAVEFVAQSLLSSASPVASVHAFMILINTWEGTLGDLIHAAKTL